MSEELVGSQVHQSAGNSETSMTILACRLTRLVACEDSAERRGFRHKLSALFGGLGKRQEIPSRVPSPVYYSLYTQETGWKLREYLLH